MRKVIGLLTLLVIAFSASAQDDFMGSGAFGQVINGDGWLRPDGSGNNSDPGKGIIKIKLDGLQSFKIGLGYERVLTEKITLGVDFLYQVPMDKSSDLLNLDALYDQVVSNTPGLDDTIKALFPSGNYGLENETVNRFYIMPEVRYYFKEAPKGFYAGLFFKYREYSYTNKFAYRNEGTNEAYNYKVDVNMNTASAGLSLGLQTFLTKTISLDVLFFGIQMSSNIGNISITPNGTAISNQVQGGVTSAVDFINNELPVKNILRTREISADLIDLESRFTSPSIRLPSIRLGLRF